MAYLDGHLPAADAHTLAIREHVCADDPLPPSGEPTLSLPSSPKHFVQGGTPR